MPNMPTKYCKIWSTHAKTPDATLKFSNLYIQFWYHLSIFQENFHLFFYKGVYLISFRENYTESKYRFTHNSNSLHQITLSVFCTNKLRYCFYLVSKGSQMNKLLPYVVIVQTFIKGCCFQNKNHMFKSLLSRHILNTLHYIQNSIHSMNMSHTVVYYFSLQTILNNFEICHKREQISNLI